MIAYQKIIFNKLSISWFRQKIYFTKNGLKSNQSVHFLEVYRCENRVDYICEIEHITDVRIEHITDVRIEYSREMRIEYIYVNVR